MKGTEMSELVALTAERDAAIHRAEEAEARIEESKRFGLQMAESFLSLLVMKCQEDALWEHEMRPLIERLLKAHALRETEADQ